MATSIMHLNQNYGSIASPLKTPAMPLKPPSKIPNHYDITKHIKDVNGITNMHIHSIGHNNDGIEFVGSKDHQNTTQWPITDEMSKIISDNNNLNRSYNPLVIPYSSACYVCTEHGNKRARKIAIGVLIAIVCLVVIIVIIVLVNRTSGSIDGESKRKKQRKNDEKQIEDNIESKVKNIKKHI
jgi:hypothetical protein